MEVIICSKCLKFKQRKSNNKKRFLGAFWIKRKYKKWSYWHNYGIIIEYNLGEEVKKKKKVADAVCCSWKRPAQMNNLWL